VIVTLTVNPSVDRTIDLDALRRGTVHRATGSRVDPGGKGINVARALAVHGVKSQAVVALGGAEGRQLADLLAEVGIDVIPVPIAGAIRSNVAVVEPDGTTTKLNEPGPRLTAPELSAILDAAVSAALDADARWLVASGSLPPGVPTTIYAELVRRLAGTRTRVAVDTSGSALAATLPAGPRLVKPNDEELAECVGTPLRTLGDVVRACHALRDRGAGEVLASLGAAGAVLVDGEGAAHAHARATTPVSSVGAGDALLAGFLAAGGEGTDALIEAVAWGTAAVTLPGSRMPGPGDLRRGDVVLEPAVELDLPLRGS
jgi:1-phosphofructokinase